MSRRPLGPDGYKVRARCMTKIATLIAAIDRFLERRDCNSARSQLKNLNALLTLAQSEGWILDKGGLVGPCMSQQQVAYWLGVTQRTVRSWAGKGYFRTFPVAHSLVLVDLVSLNQWLLSREAKRKEVA